jgi:hypothetical protein
VHRTRAATAATKSPLARTAVPASAVTTSPVRTPARAAGPSHATDSTNAPPEAASEVETPT